MGWNITPFDCITLAFVWTLYGVSTALGVVPGSYLAVRSLRATKLAPEGSLGTLVGHVSNQQATLDFLSAQIRARDLLKLTLSLHRTCPQVTLQPSQLTRPTTPASTVRTAHLQFHHLAPEKLIGQRLQTWFFAYGARFAVLLKCCDSFLGDVVAAAERLVRLFQQFQRNRTEEIL